MFKSNKIYVLFRYDTVTFYGVFLNSNTIAQNTFYGQDT